MKWVGIGVITAPHGIHGEVRVHVETDFPERFADGADITVLTPPKDQVGRRKVSQAERDAWPATRHRIVHARPHKGFMLLELEGIEDRDAADTLRGAEIVIPRSQVKPLPEGRWYVFELEGLEVYDQNGHIVGILEEVLQGAANDVYVVRAADGKEVLVPAVKHLLREVDIDKGRMVVELLEEI